jgi:Protein of unknown function (DUF3107)
MVEAQRKLRSDGLCRWTWLMSCSLPRRCNVQVPAGPVRGHREESDQVDVRIGIIQSPKELEVELKDDADREKVVADIEKLLKTGDGVLWLTDKKGRKVGVPVAKVAYIEVGAPTAERRVGFGAP